MDARSRSCASHAVRTRSYWASVSETEENGRLNSAAWVAASLGVRFGPPPPTMSGGCGLWTGLGSAGLSFNW